MHGSHRRPGSRFRLWERMRAWRGCGCAQHMRPCRGKGIVTGGRRVGGGGAHICDGQEVLQGEAAVHVHGLQHLGHHAAPQLVVRLRAAAGASSGCSRPLRAPRRMSPQPLSDSASTHCQRQSCLRTSAAMYNEFLHTLSKAEAHRRESAHMLRLALQSCATSSMTFKGNFLAYTGPAM